MNINMTKNIHHNFFFKILTCVKYNYLCFHLRVWLGEANRIVTLFFYFSHMGFWQLCAWALWVHILFFVYLFHIKLVTIFWDSFDSHHTRLYNRFYTLFVFCISFIVSSVFHCYWWIACSGLQLNNVTTN